MRSRKAGQFAIIRRRLSASAAAVADAAGRSVWSRAADMANRVLLAGWSEPHPFTMSVRRQYVQECALADWFKSSPYSDEVEFTIKAMPGGRFSTTVSSWQKGKTNCSVPSATIFSSVISL